VKFKLDENLHQDCADLLNRFGHDAMTVFQQNLSGEADPTIVRICDSENRALITADLDLSDIREFQPENHAGFIVLRMKQQSRRRQVALLSGILPLLETRPVAGHLWIVEPGKVRIRSNSPF
jgi:predicted nuclease of predicted toxin-antitoxin system